MSYDFTDDSGTVIATGVEADADGVVILQGLEPSKTYSGVSTVGANGVPSNSIDITTNAPATIAVTGVTLSQKTASMKIGDTKQVTAAVEPADATNQTVNFTSDNEKVATVAADGTISAVGEGTANVTGTTADGSFTAGVAVTVAKPVVTVTGVTIDPTTATVEVGAKATLAGKVAPDNATNKGIAFKSADEAIATVDSKTGIVTGVKAGKTDITVTTDDGAKTATASVTVTAPAASSSAAQPTSEAADPKSSAASSSAAPASGTDK